jgi:hypothetical protein
VTAVIVSLALLYFFYGIPGGLLHRPFEKNVVLDLETDKPIADAWVVFNWEQHVPNIGGGNYHCLKTAYARTDDQGKYSRPFNPYLNPWADVTLSVAVYKKGYLSSSAFLPRIYEVTANMPPERQARLRLRKRFQANADAEYKSGIQRVETATNVEEQFKSFEWIVSRTLCYGDKGFAVAPEQAKIVEEILLEATPMAKTPAQYDFISYALQIQKEIGQSIKKTTGTSK